MVLGLVPVTNMVQILVIGKITFKKTCFTLNPWLIFFLFLVASQAHMVGRNCLMQISTCY